jgi:hypothetical protein
MGSAGTVAIVVAIDCISYNIYQIARQLTILGIRESTFLECCDYLISAPFPRLTCIWTSDDFTSILDSSECLSFPHLDVLNTDNRC